MPSWRKSWKRQPFINQMVVSNLTFSIKIAIFRDTHMDVWVGLDHHFPSQTGYLRGPSPSFRKPHHHPSPMPL